MVEEQKEEEVVVGKEVYLVEFDIFESLPYPFRDTQQLSYFRFDLFPHENQLLHRKEFNQLRWNTV